MQCRAGGNLLPDAGLDEHLQGSVYSFEYFLRGKEARLLLDRQYTWIKCNRNFDGFYMTDYFDTAFEAFEVLLRNNDDDQVNTRY